MGVLFNRYCVVRFLTQGKEIGGRTELVNGELIYPPTIKFDITHTSEGDPNEAKIEVVNLSPRSQRDLLVEGDRIEIEAGYWPQDGTKYSGPIYAGQIRSAITNSRGVDTITKIECGDGDDAFSKSRLRENVGATTHANIVERLFQKLQEEGITRGTINIPDFTEIRPRTIDRLVRRELDDIAYQHDLTWHITDGKFNMYPRDNALDNTNNLITPDTGLISSPEFTDKGVRFTTLIIPDLRPGLTVQLDKSSDNKVFQRRITETVKIEEIKFSGSTNNDFFGCDIEGKFMEGDQVVRSRQRLIGNVT